MGQALEADPRGDWLRMLGGVLLAVGVVILFVRKGEEWADFPLLLAVAIPAAVVFGLGAAAALAAGEVARWHAVLMVAGVVLSAFAFGQLWDTIGIDTDSPGFGFLTAASVALLAAFASFRVGAAYQAFLAAVAGIAAWLFFFEMIFDPGTTWFRWLLLVLCVVYAATAYALRDRDVPQAPEVATATGIAGVLVGVIGPFSGGAFLGLVLGGPGGPEDGQELVWDLFLLAFSVGLVAYAAHARTRGPAYVGFLGLFAFVQFQAGEVDSLGWPLVLILVGAGALVAGMFVRERPARPPEPEVYEVRS